MVNDHISSNQKIQDLEDALEDLKSQKISKKELQSQRNKLTAQLSRDRQKLELNFLKTIGVNYLRLLRSLDRKISASESNFSQKSLKVIVDNHRANKFTTKPIHEQSMPSEKRDISYEDPTQSKRQRVDESQLDLSLSDNAKHVNKRQNKLQ